MNAQTNNNNENENICAVVFPGQGSQSFSMLADYGEHPQVLQAAREASDAAGVDFVKMINGGDDNLNNTVNTQPAMLAVTVGVFRAAGLKPALMAGHSLGEYAALVCAGSLSFAAAVKLVRRRGEVMQNAGGAMAAAVGISGEQAQELCAKLREENIMVWTANYNSPQQTVVAGNADDLSRAEDKFKNAGAKRFVRIQMSCASHCPLMNDAAEQLADSLNAAAITIPSPKVIHNTTAQAANSTDDILQLLRRHLTEPVRWVESVQNIAAAAGVIYECGPGKVLTSMNKRTAPDSQHIALASSADLAAL